MGMILSSSGEYLAFWPSVQHMTLVRLAFGSQLVIRGKLNAIAKACQLLYSEQSVRYATCTEAGTVLVWLGMVASASSATDMLSADLDPGPQLLCTSHGWAMLHGLVRPSYRELTRISTVPRSSRQPSAHVVVC